MNEEQRSEVPRLGQCFLCQCWQLEKNLSPVEVPDQAGYVRKFACEECIGKVLASNPKKVKRTQDLKSRHVI